MGEYGKVIITWIHPQSLLYEGLSAPMVVWMSHGDVITEVPPGFTVTALTENGYIASMESTHLLKKKEEKPSHEQE